MVPGWLVVLVPLLVVVGLSALVLVEVHLERVQKEQLKSRKEQ